MLQVPIPPPRPPTTISSASGSVASRVTPNIPTAYNDKVQLLFFYLLCKLYFFIFLLFHFILFCFYVYIYFFIHEM